MIIVEFITQQQVYIPKLSSLLWSEYFPLFKK